MPLGRFNAKVFRCGQGENDRGNIMPLPEWLTLIRRRRANASWGVLKECDDDASYLAERLGAVPAADFFFSDYEDAIAAEEAEDDRDDDGSVASPDSDLERDLQFARHLQMTLIQHATGQSADIDPELFLQFMSFHEADLDGGDEVEFWAWDGDNWNQAEPHLSPRRRRRTKRNKGS